jgi:methylated-DNA-protein-cysteine methyltransferase-like protein
LKLIQPGIGSTIPNLPGNCQLKNHQFIDLPYHNRQIYAKFRAKYEEPGSEMTESTLRIIAALNAVPPGRVSCYRDIALAAGLPNGARQVVRILHSLSRSHRLPWHRIIRADGRIALPAGAGKEEQIALLRAEGVKVNNAGVVDLRYFMAKVHRPSR